MENVTDNLARFKVVFNLEYIPLIPEVCIPNIPQASDFNLSNLNCHELRERFLHSYIFKYGCIKMFVSLQFLPRLLFAGETGLGDRFGEPAETC